MSEISSEAVEAAARALHGTTEEQWELLPLDVILERRADAHAALTAALPYLAAHQPARVAPSAEEVRLIVHTALHGVPMHWTARGTAADEVAAAVLDLYARTETKGGE